MKDWMPLIVCGTVLAVLSSRIPTDLNVSGIELDPGERARVNQSALGRVLGEFRTGTSDLLFVKTERYLHGGVGYVPHEDPDMTDQNGRLKMDQQVWKEAHADLDTLIPDEDKDYRGWIGHMQREVKPWTEKGGHVPHGAGADLIPWFRMMTLSDPQYIQGYLTGAFWLSKEDPEAAVAFLEEGLKKNPKAFQLHYSKGMFLIRDIRNLDPEGRLNADTPAQKELMKQARAEMLQALEILLDEFPRGLTREERVALPSWGRYKDQDAMSTALVAVTLETRYGEPGAGEALRQRVLAVIPDHRNL